MCLDVVLPIVNSASKYIMGKSADIATVTLLETDLEVWIMLLFKVLSHKIRRFSMN